METKSGKSTFTGNRRLLYSTAAVSIVSILLLAGLGLTLAHAETNGGVRHVHEEGTFTTRRSYVNGPPFPSNTGLTIIDYNVVTVASNDAGTQTGTANNLNTLAIDSTGMGRATGYGTNWGTVGDSAPGLYSLITTFTIDVTKTPAAVTGNFVIVPGSGQGGLAGICGTETFTGTVNLATGAGSFTYDLEAQFGGTCPQVSSESG